MIEKVLADFGRIDILINNAGIGMRKPFVETPLATIEEIMRINYLGAVYCTHAVLPSMIARGGRPYRQYLLRRRQDRHAQHGGLLRVEVRHERLVGEPLSRAQTAGHQRFGGLSRTGQHAVQPRVSKTANPNRRPGCSSAPAAVAPAQSCSHREQAIRSGHAALAGAHVLRSSACRPVYSALSPNAAFAPT